MKRQKLNSRRTAALLASTLVLSQAEPDSGAGRCKGGDGG